MIKRVDEDNGSNELVNLVKNRVRLPEAVFLA